MKILVITPLFALAGVPLSQIRFARALLERKHEVELIIGHVPQDFIFDKPKNLKIKIFNKLKVRSMLFPLIKYLWREKPDVIFTAEDHLNIVVLIAAILSFTKAKISCSSRVTPYDTYRGGVFSKGWFLKQLSRLLMRKADALTCVSEDMVLQYKNIFYNSKHVCVYNIVDNSFSRSLMNEKVSHKWLLESNFPIIVAAGRLAPWKGFTNLIQAMALLNGKVNAKLLILGDGPQRKELQELIEKYDLQENIDLVGYVTNPYKYFARSNIFVLSSRVEGLPNVLVEAMMCGCTPVSTNCPTGPREVLSDGKFGYLVPVDDPVRLAESIAYALNNPIHKKDLYNAIIPFREDEVINKHFRILGFNQ
jgi:glycosyltransferase involved in cell wall biosynthesis